jgi:phosphohistidine swiveling domain-containing protein
MYLAARSFFTRYQTEEKLHKLFRDFDAKAETLKKLYKDHTKNEILLYSEEELVAFSRKIWKAYQGFWQLGLFIDAFDAGFDIEKTREIQENCALTDAEVALLITPREMLFVNERVLRLLTIMQRMPRRVTGHRDALQKFVRTSSEIKEYITDYDYYKSNYARISHITEEEIVEEIQNLLKDDREKREYTRLASYGDEVKKNIKGVLKNHKLKTNPLFLFQRLVFWREYRKQVNLMGIHLMHYILFSLEQKTGIPYKYLKHLTFDEIGNVLKGLVTRDQLARRYEKGILFSTVGSHYRVIEGSEAESIHEELERKIRGEGNERVLTGQVACQGYAKGIARIILGQTDFEKFGEGEILVTGMTRPEFLPLMKRAAGIVTNEGGITCHAAIVSRELGKPCIIGTQKATQVIKDGDLVEVRANHGTVRVLGRR